MNSSIKTRKQEAWRHPSRWCAALALCLSVAACSNSKLVLRPLYNSADNRFEDPIFEHTKFTQDQTTQISELLDHYHVWHRQTQLGLYAGLLDQVVAHQREDNIATESDIERWWKTINDYRENLLSCSPFYLSAPIFASLTDEQVSDIKEHRIESRQKRRAAREKREAKKDEIIDFEAAADESIEDRIKNIKRYLGFVGFELNQAQLDDLKDTMGKTMKPDSPFGPMVVKWDRELESLMDQRASPNWDAVLVDYIDRRRTAMSARRDKVRDHNRQVWKDYALRTVQSFDGEQRKAAASYLGGLSETAKALALDEPSYTKQTASDYVCRGRRIN